MTPFYDFLQAGEFVECEELHYCTLLVWFDNESGFAVILLSSAEIIVLNLRNFSSECRWVKADSLCHFRLFEAS